MEIVIYKMTAGGVSEKTPPDTNWSLLLAGLLRRRVRRPEGVSQISHSLLQARLVLLDDLRQVSSQVVDKVERFVRELLGRVEDLVVFRPLRSTRPAHLLLVL